MFLTRKKFGHCIDSEEIIGLCIYSVVLVTVKRNYGNGLTVKSDESMARHQKMYFTNI